MLHERVAPFGVLGRCLCVWTVGAALFLFLAPTKALAQTNLVVNPSFELISNGLPLNWTACNFSSGAAATLATVTAPVDQGTHSLKVTVTATGDVGVCSDPIVVSSGVTFRVSARSNVNNGTTTNKQARLQILELASGNVQVASKVIATTIGRTNGWETVSGFFTTSPSTTQVKIRLVQDLPTSANVAFYWDSVSLVSSTAVAWERWEREFTSNTAYSAGTNSNPYRDVQLTATFYTGSACGATPPSSCSLPNCFQQSGFWDGTQGSASAKTFRVRTTLPVGVWCWNTTCSTVPSTGSTTPSCAGDIGLNQNGSLTVTPYGGNNKLYRLGLPKPKNGGNFLVYADGTTTFPWIADTAWSAPANLSLPATGAPPSADLWKNYVADRAGKNFTVLLVAPANQYINAPASRPTPPASGFAGFLAETGCTPANYKVVPNECSYLDPAYWRKLDSMIKDANDAGLVVMVAGLIDPTDRGGPGTLLTPLQKYPRKEAAAAFARQLAARLAGSFVFFSPGFDDKVTELLDDGVTQTQASMTAVGQALRSTGGAAPRHLVGNQLAGGAALTDYDLFHGADWLSFEFYQSGHKGNLGTPCSYASPQEYARSVCRARELTLRFRCQGATSTVQACPNSLPPGQSKPAVNSEGAYEDFSTIPDDPDTREGERHSAYVSALSGSFGYTIGILGIRDWSNPSVYSNNYQNDQSKSDTDLGTLAGFMNGGPWTALDPRHNLIANNPPVNTATTNPTLLNQDPANEKTRMLLAANSTYGLVYVPGVSSSFVGVKIKTAGAANTLGGFNCGPCWSKFWVDPRKTVPDLAANCSVGNGTVTLSTPRACPDSKPCDWVIRLTKGSSPACSGAAPNASQNDLRVWTELSDDATTSTVIAQVIDPTGLPVYDPIVVSPDGVSFQKLPTPAIDAFGNFFIAWEATNPDTGLDEVHARSYDSTGNPLADAFVASPASDGQQAEPSVTSDSNNNFAVSWTRYDLSDAPASVEIQVFAASGAPGGETIGLPPDPGGGSATMSLIQADGLGNLWVAWTVEDRKHVGEGDVYAQRIPPGGVLSDRPIKVSTTHAGVRRLASFRVQKDGSFRVVWEGLGSGGQGRGYRERSYNAQGHPTNDETSATSGD